MTNIDVFMKSQGNAFYFSCLTCMLHLVHLKRKQWIKSLCIRLNSFATLCVFGLPVCMRILK